MSRLIDRILVVMYVALAAAPAIACVLGLRGWVIRGSVPPAPVPRLTYEAFVRETFQVKLGAWFEARLGLKGFAVAIDNALLYRGFGETKPGSAVRIGIDRVLFSDEDLNYYNKRGDGIPTPAHVDALVARIAKLQRRFAGEHRAFVPVLIPSKTSVWRDKVPVEWTVALGDPRPTDVGVYRAFKAALDRHGVKYVDARAMFETSPTPRELLFSADGRHWSAYGACLTMKAITGEATSLTGRVLTYECLFSIKPGAWTRHDDFDLWRLLNALWVEPSLRFVPAVSHAAPLPSGSRSSLLFIGTSFCWELLRDAANSGRFGELAMNYYNKQFVQWPLGKEHREVNPGTPEWSATTLGKDIYVLDLFEGYLGAPGAYVDLFVDDLERALDRP